MSDDAIKLVAFDMDGCLAADPTVWELVHRRLGTWDSHGRPYWQRFLAGGLDYDEFEDLVHTVASVADEWDDRLAELFPNE